MCVLLRDFCVLGYKRFFLEVLFKVFNNWYLCWYWLISMDVDLGLSVVLKGFCYVSI